MYLENRKFVRKRNVMDIQTRKYHLIQELFSIEKESTIEALESIVIKEKDNSFELTKEQKRELDRRLQMHKENPKRGRSWEEVEKDLNLKYGV